MCEAQLLQSLLPDLFCCRFPFVRVEESRKSAVGMPLSVKALHSSVRKYSRRDLSIHKKASMRLFSMPQQSINIGSSPPIHWPPCNRKERFRSYP